MARTATRNRTEHKPTEPQFVRPTRPSKEPCGPYGGQMKHVPADCEYKRQDKEGFWADCITCANTCKDIDCTAYKVMMGGQKTRLRLMNSEPCKETCPHCKSLISSKSEDLVTVTYVCGTVGDRLTHEYAFTCKQPQRPVRRARR